MKRRASMVRWGGMAWAAFWWLALPPAEAHEHKPPHHGALQVLGEEAAHVEMVLEAETGQLVAYVLDGEAENAVRIAAPSLTVRITTIDPPPPGWKPSTVDLAAVANVLTGEIVGDTSQFEGTVSALQHARRFQGTIPAIVVKGARFRDVAVYYPEGNEAHEAERPEHAAGGSP